MSKTKAIVKLNNVKQIATGNFHTVVLMEDMTLKAWGYNSYGQLGDGTTIDKSVPTTVLGLSGVNPITAGNCYTAALKNDGTIKVWGRNNYGQLGDETTTNRITPTPININ